MELMLASASPQRRALLEAAGYRFVAVAADVDELESGVAPADLAGANARLKATAVAGAHPGRVVVGADTVVAIGGRSFGKPAGESEAMEMLAALAGCWHEVHTGVCVVAGGEVRSATATTQVKFRPLDAGEIVVTSPSGSGATGPAATRSRNRAEGSSRRLKAIATM